MLVNTVNGNLLRAHVNGDGVSQKGVGKTGNGTWHGSAKEQVLAFLWQEFEHLLDVSNKAHVQHSVGFIQNEELNVRNVDVSLSYQIQEPSWCGNEDVKTFL